MPYAAIVPLAVSDIDRLAACGVDSALAVISVGNRNAGVRWPTIIGDRGVSVNKIARSSV